MGELLWLIYPCILRLAYYKSQRILPKNLRISQNSGSQLKSTVTISASESPELPQKIPFPGNSRTPAKKLWEPWICSLAYIDLEVSSLRYPLGSMYGLGLIRKGLNVICLWYEKVIVIMLLSVYVLYLMYLKENIWYISLDLWVIPEMTGMVLV